MTLPLWFISDTHFSHSNITLYEPVRKGWCEDTESMDRAMREAWNTRVGPDDLVLHCGDFAFGTKENIQSVRTQLRGRILLVVGNHDRSAKVMEAQGVDRAVRSYEFEHEGRLYIARHNPANFTPEEAARAHVLLHGHTHSRPAPESVPQEIRRKCFCLSVESLGGPGPLSWEEISSRFPLP